MKTFSAKPHEVTREWFVVDGAGKGNLAYEGVISDPESGVVMSYRRWYDADAGKMSGRFEVMPGFAVCNNAVVRLLKG